MAEPAFKSSPEARILLAQRRRWSWAAGLNTVAALLLAAVLGGMAHYLAARHYARWDWSRTQYYALSEKTRSLLGGLTNDVEITVLFQSSDALRADVEALLKEYQYASRRLHVKRVDPARDVARLAELAKKYPVTEANVVIFDSGGRHRIVGRKDMADFDLTPAAQRRPPRLRAFKGEQAFSTALLQVTQARTPVVYFLTGHGEKNIESLERRTGLAQLVRLIRQDNTEVRPLLLGEEKSVPSDADALVIAGPTRRLAQPELDVIAQYLERNGRAVLLLETQTSTGLEPLLARWGVNVGDDLVVDPARTLGGGLVISRFTRHPVTAHIRDVASVFYTPRSVEAAPAAAGADAADRPHVMGFAMTSEAGWAESDLEQRPMKYDEGRDRKGPVAVAAAVERGPAPGLDMAIRPARFVVFGDANFVANGGLVSGNGDLFMSALNWVLDRRALMAIAPKSVAEMRLDLNASQLRKLGWIVVAGLPALAGLAGLFVALRRRA